jgi:hypothetical protein
MLVRERGFDAASADALWEFARWASLITDLFAYLCSQVVVNNTAIIWKVAVLL